MRYVTLLNRFRYSCFWMNTSSSPTICKLFLNEDSNPVSLSIMNFNVYNRPNTASSIITKDYFVNIDGAIVIKPHCNRIFYQSNNKRNAIGWVSNYVFSKEGVKDVFSILYDIINHSKPASLNPYSNMIKKVLSNIDDTYEDDDYVYNTFNLKVYTI